MKDKNRMEEYVDRAQQTNDFSEVSDIIEKSVEYAISLTKTGANALIRGIGRSLNKDEMPKPINEDPAYVQQKITTPNTYKNLRNLSFVVAIGTAIGFIMTILDSFFAFTASTIPSLVMLLIVGLGSLYISYRMHHKMKKMRRFVRYRTEIGNNRVLPMEDFATAVHLSPEQTAIELNDFIEKGYFPQARIVENGKMFLVDRTAYDAYKHHYYKSSEVEETEESPEIDMDDRMDMISDYVKTLHSQSKQIQNKAFKEDVLKLLSILESIKGRTFENPEQLEDLNKFVDYYTPTTIKLVDSYLEFESSTIPLDSIEKSKRDIEKSINTINKAFTNLLEELFKDDILDINSDIEVMHTLLVQDGLIETNEMKERVKIERE